MIERNIPKDITKYEAKLIGPFTTRQVVCYIPGIIIAIGVNLVLYKVIGDLSLLVSIILATPFFLCGSWKPYGIPLEKFAKKIIVGALIAPSKRKYKTDDPFSSYFPTINETPSIDKKKALKYRSGNPENKILP